MKIKRIEVYQVDLPLYEGSYNWSGGKSVAVFDSTIVALETDSGLAGFGEVCPLGPAYLPAYAAGARAGIAELGPAVIGMDPTQLGVLNRRMDAALKGHPYAKSAIDIACWDILGQVAGMPAAEMLGGRYGDDVILYRAISQDTPEAMAGRVAGYRAEGYRRFQLKVGSSPETDIQRIRAVSAVLEPGDLLVADANTGWLKHEAMRVVRAVRDVDVYIEQPCLSYEECRSIREHTDHPFVLDETIDGIDTLLRAAADRAMDVVNIKISKFGGLTKAKQARDLCVSLGVAMTIEDTWGGDITTAAIAHLAHSTPPEFLFTSTDFNSYVTVSTAEGAPQRHNGRMAASTQPGLGVTPADGRAGRSRDGARVAGRRRGYQSICCPSPSRRASRNATCDAATSCNASPTDLNKVIWSSEPRPAARPETRSPIAQWMWLREMIPCSSGWMMSPASSSAASRSSTTSSERATVSPGISRTCGWYEPMALMWVPASTSPSAKTGSTAVVAVQTMSAPRRASALEAVAVTSLGIGPRPASSAAASCASSTFGLQMRTSSIERTLAHRLDLRPRLHAAADDRQHATVGAGQQIACQAAHGRRPDGGQRAAVHHGQRSPGVRLQDQYQAVDGRQVAGLILRVDRHNLDGDRGIVFAHDCAGHHQRHAAPGRERRTQWRLHLFSRKRGECRAHRADRGRHRQRLAHILRAEQQHVFPPVVTGSRLGGVNRRRVSKASI